MITVQEFALSPVLQDYVRFYQYSKTRLGTATLFRPLPARPEQFLQFSLRERYIVIDRTSRIRSKAPPIVILGRQTHRIIDLLATDDVVTFTIHFQPTGFYRLFALQLAANLAVDRDGVRGLHRAETFQIDRHVSHADLGDRHRDGERLFLRRSVCFLSGGALIDEYRCGNQGG